MKSKSAHIIHSQSIKEYWFEEGCHIREISNSSNDANVSIARARVAPGGRTCWHRLDGIFERYLVTEGHGTVEVGDLAPEAVGAGDLVLIPPGVRQRISNDGHTDLVFYAICSPRFSAERYRSLETGDPD
jgi:mannose-6-phosphate isomerase-like protein (cupin superfamily)